MAWTTPPTFADGATVTAAQLNALSANCVYLSQMLLGANIPFGSWALDVDDADEHNNMWYVTHMHRYLHYKIRLTAGDLTEVSIRYNNLNVWGDSGSFASPHTYEGYVDLHDTGVITPTPTYGVDYSVWAVTDGDPAADVTVDYIIESSETIL